MATKTKKVVTPLKDENVSVKFASPLGTPVLDDRQVPGPTKVDDWREGFEKEYGWIAPNNVIGFYRAILQELYRMRVGK